MQGSPLAHMRNVFLNICMCPLSGPDCGHPFERHQAGGSHQLTTHLTHFELSSTRPTAGLLALLATRADQPV